MAAGFADWPDRQGREHTPGILVSCPSRQPAPDVMARLAGTCGEHSLASSGVLPAGRGLECFHQLAPKTLGEMRSPLECATRPDWEPRAKSLLATHWQPRLLKSLLYQKGGLAWNRARPSSCSGHCIFRPTRCSSCPWKRALTHLHATPQCPMLVRRPVDLGATMACAGP